MIVYDENVPEPDDNPIFFLIAICFIVIMAIILIASHYPNTAINNQQRHTIDTAAFIHIMDSSVRAVGYREYTETIVYNDSDYPTKTIVEDMKSKSTHHWHFFFSESTKTDPTEFSLSWDTTISRSMTVIKKNAHVHFSVIQSHLVLDN